VTADGTVNATAVTDLVPTLSDKPRYCGDSLWLKARIYASQLNVPGFHF